MNKIVFKLLFVLLSLNLCPLMAEIKNSLEIRAAAFFHSSNRFRDIYGHVDGSYQLEASTRFTDYFETWGNFDWFSKHGKSKGFKDPTRVSIANISLGIKFPYQLGECFTVYAGIGPSLSRIWLNNRSACSHEQNSKLAIGGVLKTGVYYFITSRIFLDVFVDYLYQPVHFETNIDIGGFKTGIGVGFKF